MSDFQQELENLKKGYEPKQFNVFRSLCKESDEVELHSRFIASLLDPNNPSRLGLRPLELFLKIIRSNFKVGPDTKLTPGWGPENWKEDEEIDILIEDKTQGFAIIIENKIFAPDSNHPNGGQLERYHRYITGNESKRKRDKTYKDNQVEVYYLTLDGHKPSDDSLGTKEKGYLHISDNNEPRSVKLIEYRKEICNWLNELLGDKLLGEMSDCTYVKSAIKQYRNLVLEFAGDIDLHQKLTCLAGQYPDEAWKRMQSDDNLFGLKKKDVLWHSIVDFLNEFETALRNAHYEIEPRIIPIYEAVSNLIFGHNKSDEKFRIYFRIPDKRGWVWTIQSNEKENGKFFLGIDRSTKVEPEDQSLRENRDNSWFYRKNLTPDLCLSDVLELKDETTFKCIINPNERTERIKDYMADIEKVLKQTL